MPFDSDDVIWGTLLSICGMNGNVEVAEKAASACSFEIGPSRLVGLCSFVECVCGC
ncbi:hypothetical protein CASFOL_026716 [Castilleja foliolosa]|uniref:Pentatricopeptide repeat-containing protein n=1 Tax=Castilleja foliolosa TaxID=1961234 RepID=A0ABD3CJT3_9LAMI